jgi:hypothetical protein
VWDDCCMDIIKECVLATRPWSFTAGLIPILVTTALVSTNKGYDVYLHGNFIRALVMGISIQAAANLTNTCMPMSVLQYIRISL